MLIFCDLDGVLVDFVKGIEELYEVDLKSNWTKGNYDIGIELQKHNIVMDWNLSIEFWRDLQFTEEANEILKILKDKNFLIVSKYYNDASELGKSTWLSRHGFSKFILTKEPKYKLFQGIQIETCLVDDNDEEIRNFKKGLLIPRPWNSSERTIEEFFDILKSI